ncbi:MAG: zinc ABC transporter ATP-binding protein [Bacteroidetes bacterium HGW-Bacteroidetes-22]|nr:MAG: zinc ABC transporter ATP-binding protein [Bacteroidetes bacterium HGW-Bacteroidetes-22]
MILKPIPPLLQLKDLGAGYNGRAVLHDVNLTVRANDFIGVIGPNGGGKTTLLKVITGLLSPITGSIIYGPMLANGRRIGYLPQMHQYDRNFPILVRDVVLSGGMGQRRLINPFNRDDRKQALELMAMTGLSQLQNHPIGDLSGGQAQRVFLCRALMNDPALLILDEPANFVDAGFEAELYEILHDLNKKMAIIMVTHDLGIITPYVKTIACVNGDLHYHPSSEITQDLLATYRCPIELITHGTVPHRVLKTHTNP